MGTPFSLIHTQSGTLLVKSDTWSLFTDRFVFVSKLPGPISSL